ncbi:MAG TPA: GDSL-type esterase/lipase family protein [Ktedonobacteraceae bacterium]|nr:GDSL-type esterase/lipase family protein [Ktedonobacteraceae bacterium]
MRKPTGIVAALLILFLLASCASTTITQQPAGGSSPASQATPTHQSSQPSGTFTHAITYVALGASDAVGVGSDTPGAQGYVPLIAAHLPKGSHMLDLGISGIHLHEALSEELPLALSTSPDLVTIWLVANDFVGGVTYNDYMQDLVTLLSQLRSHTHARIVMADLPDLTRLPAFANQTAAQKSQMLAGIQQWNRGIAQQAARYAVTLVDLFSQGSTLTAHPEYISGDGFHPSPAGYIQLANLFWKAIQQQ